MKRDSKKSRRFANKSELDELLRQHRRESNLPVELGDNQTTGLMIRVRLRQATAWYVYKTRDGKKHRIELGEYPAVTLADLRNRRDREAGRRADETQSDPHELVAEKRRAQELAAAEAAAEAERGRWTVQAVANAYLGFIGRERSARTEKGYRSHFDIYIIPAFGGRELTTITPDDVVAILNGLKDAGRYRQRNAVRTTLLGFFNWIRDRERNRDVRHLWGLPNPVAETRALKKRDVSGWKDRSKEPLSSTVLKSVSKVLWDKRTSPYEGALLLQLLTGQRASQVVEADWADINLKAKIWRPATKNPNSKHKVHLSPQALSVLVTRGSREGRVFPGIHYRTCLDRLLEYATESGADAQDVGTHSLRKNVLTAIRREFGCPVEVRMFVADHAQSDLLEKTYVKSDWSEEAAKALDKWGKKIECMATGSNKTREVN